MEAPKRIFIYENSDEWEDADDPTREDTDIVYIRADLVEKLKWYAVHGNTCRASDPRGWDGLKPSCTCGLTEVLKEIDG